MKDHMNLGLRESQFVVRLARRRGLTCYLFVIMKIGSFYFPLFALALLDISAFAQSYSITTVVGSSRLRDGNPATSVPLRYPYGVAQDAAGNIYFADSQDNRVRKVGTDGKISTVAGTGVAGFTGDGGPATEAMFDGPQGLRLDAKGALRPR
jgi:hypothetical protein